MDRYQRAPSALPRVTDRTISLNCALIWAYLCQTGLFVCIFCSVLSGRLHQVMCSALSRSSRIYVTGWSRVKLFPLILLLEVTYDDPVLSRVSLLNWLVIRRN